MSNLATNPAFIAYAVSLVVLCLNMLFLWGYSGGVRGKTKTTPNEEDAKSVAKGSKVVQADPPEVDRVLRAHRNASANIVPFAILGLVWVLAGATPTAAAVIFGVFTVARLAHSFAYLGAKQPWRTLSFVVGAGTTLVMVGFLIRSLVAAA